MLESGLILDLGNLFRLIFPNTFLANLSIQPGFKFNCLIEAKMKGTGGATNVTSEFPMISTQFIRRFGYNLGRFSLYVEFGDPFNHLDNNKKYSHFGTNKDVLASKVVFSSYL